MKFRPPSLLALALLLLLPTDAFSLRLFEGNLGYDSEWLHVLGAPGMTDRVYWYELGDDVTYQAQFDTDPGFLAPDLDVSGIVNNYIEPGLDPGFYYFRVREIHASGVAGSWSETGTLEVLRDTGMPEVRILAPSDEQVFLREDTLSIEFEASDDTVLSLARFTIGGDYAGTLGLKTENYKVNPSFGEWLPFVFNYQIPKNAGKGPLEIWIDVSDVMGNVVSALVVIEVGRSSTEQNQKRGRGNDH